MENGKSEKVKGIGYFTPYITNVCSSVKEYNACPWIRTVEWMTYNSLASVPYSISFSSVNTRTSRVLHFSSVVSFPLLLRIYHFYINYQTYLLHVYLHKHHSHNIYFDFFFFSSSPSLLLLLLLPLLLLDVPIVLFTLTFRVSLTRVYFVTSRLEISYVVQVHTSTLVYVIDNVAERKLESNNDSDCHSASHLNCILSN